MKIYCFTIIGLLLYTLSYSQGSSNMTLHNQYNPSTTTYAGVKYNDCWGYTDTNGDEYALIGTPDSVIIMKVNDCWTAERVNAFAGGSTTIWRDIKTYSNYAYSVCDGTPCNEGLKILDMTTVNNATPSVTTNSSFFTKAHNIYIDEANARLYVVGAPGFDMIILNITNPTSPTLIANVDLNTITMSGEDFYIHDIYVKNNIAYCSHGNTGYYVWDVSTITSTTGAGITLQKSTVTGGYNHSSWTTNNDNYAFFAEELPQGRELGVIDLNTQLVVKRFSNPLLGSGIPTPHNPYIIGNSLYVSYYEDGLAVFDISSPLNPIKTAYYDTYTNSSYSGTNGNWGVYPFFSSGCLVATDISNGVHFLKVGTFVPVEWLDFSARLINDRSVELNWSTATELNNEYFEIERSLDGENYESIERQEGQGTSYEIEHYSAYDTPNALGAVYYRIKQVDFDGTASYTDIAKVTIDTNKGTLSIFPNPATNYLELTVNDDSFYNYSILDLQGRELNKGVLSHNTERISLLNLLPGNYFINLTNASGDHQKFPFMIVK